MASVFTKIINGEIPGRFVWADQSVVVMATIEPTRPGHVMVIPRAQVNKYSDVDPEVFAHAMKVSQIIGRAQELAFDVPRAIVSILGFEVPHTHIHVIPAESEDAAKFSNAKLAPGAELDEAMEKLRAALVESGYGEFVPAHMDKLEN
ncbi:MAG: HIT family protein [Actinomycetaceae bacterium]|nr:HIT family protein [Actinomycetaceae bacterium]